YPEGGRAARHVRRSVPAGASGGHVAGHERARPTVLPALRRRPRRSRPIPRGVGGPAHSSEGEQLMVTRSAVADEVTTDLADQITTLRAVGIDHVDVRGIGGRNVTTLDAAEVRDIRRTLDANEIGVASLASPIGKCPVDTPLVDLHGQVEQAATYAHILGTPLVRVFSFYPAGVTAPPEPDSVPVDDAAWRDGALERLDAMTSWARDSGITLLVEN